LVSKKGDFEMTTERRIYSEQDMQEVTKGEELLRAKGLNESNERIVDLLDKHFQANRALPVTATAISQLIQAQPGLKWLSPAELEFRRIAAENPAAAEKLAAWFATQGRPGTLEATGDLYFLNASNLLQELRGREVTAETIAAAIGRIGAPASRFDTRKRTPLHYVPESRPVDPRQKQDDGTPFLGRDVNEPRWKRIQRERQESEAREAASQPSSTSVQSSAVREAKLKAEQLRGNTHSESEQIQRVFVMTPGTSEIDWSSTLAARLNLQKAFNKHREVARFIR
jgi:hypothetical protein